MFKRFRARISSAHVMAGLALFIALGGSAYAVKGNSVGSKQIKKGAVKTSKIANNAVKTAKIADGAVNGAKVDESSLGQVPSAATADSATSAGAATSADTATSADSAVTATDSGRLDGRTLQQVRGLADASSVGVTNGLPAAGPFEQVITEDIGIPTGGASVIAQASIELENNSGNQVGAQCELRDEGAAISQRYNVTIPPGFATTIPLSGFVNEPLGTAAFNPRDIAVFCLGSGVANDVRFLSGDLVVQRVPTGAGA